jgi:hypothetical protein
MGVARVAATGAVMAGHIDGYNFDRVQLFHEHELCDHTGGPAVGRVVKRWHINDLSNFAVADDRLMWLGSCQFLSGWICDRKPWPKQIASFVFCTLSGASDRL